MKGFRLVQHGWAAHFYHILSQIRLALKVRNSGGFSVTNADGSLVGPWNAMVYSPLIGGLAERMGSFCRHQNACAPDAWASLKWQWTQRRYPGEWVDSEDSKLEKLEDGIVSSPQHALQYFYHHVISRVMGLLWISSFVQLREDLIEIGILVVGREWKSQFEWYVHEKLALKAGVSEEAGRVNPKSHPAVTWWVCRNNWEHGKRRNSRKGRN